MTNSEMENTIQELKEEIIKLRKTQEAGLSACAGYDITECNCPETVEAFWTWYCPVHGQQGPFWDLYEDDWKLTFKNIKDKIKRIFRPI